MSIIPNLHGNDLIALETTSWITDSDTLDVFMRDGVKLFEGIK